MKTGIDIEFFDVVRQKEIVSWAFLGPEEAPPIPSKGENVILNDILYTVLNVVYEYLNTNYFSGTIVSVRLREDV